MASHQTAFFRDRRLVVDDQISATLNPPQTLPGELRIHGALDVFIQELIAHLNWVGLNPLICFVGAEIGRTIVVELHLLRERQLGQAHQCSHIDEFFSSSNPLWGTKHIQCRHKPSEIGSIDGVVVATVAQSMAR
jgi:hypothetical protein